ncbi:MAG: UvrD-helicase domain-containing protein [Candidatus Blackburnbacteria bacterium]|nr:UvrD-helicase domain-containing protein [Candidatus Blackburnbacteria bacterium]
MALDSILADLNPNQQAAVTYWGSPLLVLAGAGSGKTKVLTHRAAWLIQENKINASGLLAITFTNKAAGEMKERMINLIGSTPGFAGTFHAFCARILRQYGSNIGIDPDFVIYDTADQLDAIKNVMARLGLGKSFKPGSLLSVVSQAKNELVTASEFAQYAQGDWQRKAALVFLEYQRLLKDNHALDFDDLLTSSVKLLKDSPETLPKLGVRFQYILVDEWQDTNKAQYEIVRLLARANGNQLTVVGDAAQSVYGWRGANYRNISYLSKDFSNLKTLNLDQNYRSTQVILDAAYGVINKNKNHPILKLWTENPNGERIKLYQARSEMDEASFVVRELKNLLTQSFIHSDIAVLYRINAQSRALEEAFLHEGIPYTLIGGVRFYDRREVKDVLAYLKLLANPNDSISRRRAELLGKRRFAAFERLQERLTKRENFTLELLDQVLETTSYMELYDKNDPEDQARLENIKELRSVATEFPNLAEFLEQVALVETAQNSTKGHITHHPSLVTAKL